MPKVLKTSPTSTSIESLMKPTVSTEVKINEKIKSNVEEKNVKPVINKEKDDKKDEGINY